MNFLSTQWSTDGSTSSEPMGLCITSIVKTLTDNHTLDDRNHQGHHTTLLLSKTVVQIPSKSVRQQSQELGINRESVRKILIADPHMYPYRIQIKQKLIPGDIRKRMIMCHWHGYSSVSLTDWSAAGVTRSGRRIHRSWTSQIFICGDTLRTGCMATTPRLSLNWRQQSQQQ